MMTTNNNTKTKAGNTMINVDDVNNNGYHIVRNAMYDILDGLGMDKNLSKNRTLVRDAVTKAMVDYTNRINADKVGV